MEKLEIRDVFKRGWEAAKGNMVLLCGLSVTYFLLTLLLSGAEMLAPHSMLVKILSNLFALVIGCLLIWLMSGFSLQAVRRMEVGSMPHRSFLVFSLNYLVGAFITSIPLLIWVVWQSLNLEQFFASYNLTYSLLMWLLLSFMVAFLLYLVVYIRFGFFTYIIIERDVNFWQAIRHSIAISKGYVFNILCVSLLCFLIMVVGVLFLFVGFFPACAVVLCVMAELYISLDRLYEQKQALTKKEVTDVE